LYLLIKKRPFDGPGYKMILRYSVYFNLISFLNCWATFASSNDPGFEMLKTIATRTMSMVCIWSFLVCCIYWSRKETIYGGMMYVSSLMFIFSIIAYLFFREEAVSIESTGVYAFKGVAGNRNSFILYVLCFFLGAAVLLFRRDWKDKEKLKKNIFFAVIVGLFSATGIFFEILSGSRTGVFVLFLFIALLAVFAFVKIKFPAWLVPALYCGIWLVIGIIGIENIIPKQIFESVFGRSITLSMRTVLWDIAKEIMPHSVIAGFGFDNTILASLHLVADGNSYINDPHNSLLYILLTQGAVGLIAIIYMFVKPLSKAVSVRGNRTVTFILIFISVMILRGLVESIFQYTDTMLWCMLIALEVETEKAGGRTIAEI
ncbi:MAG: O-antigen ligase family protein, partial [Firmicutes bacterium]|nr:O-antigen ligase family protein [Bacillota bacterium]